MKLLLVEDDMEISQMLKDYLRAENYEVVCAADGEEASEKFDSDSYALVLLDLMIPKISGMEVMQHIRQSSTVPIIIVSAKDTDADKTLGLGLGADDYITKPFSVTEVLGGGWDSGAGCGAWYLGLADASSARYRDVGGRLLYVPQTKISA